MPETHVASVQEVAARGAMDATLLVGSLARERRQAGGPASHSCRPRRGQQRSPGERWPEVLVWDLGIIWGVELHQPQGRGREGEEGRGRGRALRGRSGESCAAGAW